MQMKGLRRLQQLLDRLRPDILQHLVASRPKHVLTPLDVSLYHIHQHYRRFHVSSVNAFKERLYTTRKTPALRCKLHAHESTKGKYDTSRLDIHDGSQREGVPFKRTGTQN